MFVIPNRINHIKTNDGVKLRFLPGPRFLTKNKAAKVRTFPPRAFCRKPVSVMKVQAEYLTLAELAVYASVCVNTLKKWATRGMPVYKVGGVCRVKKSEFDEWFRQFRNGTESEDLDNIWDQVMEEV